MRLRKLVLFSVALAGLFVATSGAAPLAPDDPLAPLSHGSLEVWVPDTFFTGMPHVTRQYQWSPLLSEFQNDFPSFELRFHIMGRESFVQSIQSPTPGPSPDIVFADNQSEAGPLLDSNAVTKLLGPSRFFQNGWWLVFRKSKNYAAGEAFLLWLSQSPHWQPWHLATARMDESDSAAVQAVSTETVKEYLQADAHSLSSLMDPQASGFYRLIGSDGVGQVQPLLTFGDSRLAFVLTSAVCRQDKALGIAHSALVLRKVEGRWKVLLFLDGALPELEALLKHFDKMQLQDGPQETLPVVKIRAPEDHAKIARFSSGELQWEAVNSLLSVYLVESQYSNPRADNWSTSRIAFVSPPRHNPLVTTQIPFGAGKQPHRWRVWAISTTGDVSISDWRIIDFTN
jgi:hypothetical protein